MSIVQPTTVDARPYLYVAFSIALGLASLAVINALLFGIAHHIDWIFYAVTLPMLAAVV